MCDKCVKKSLFNVEIISKLKIPQESVELFAKYLKASSYDQICENHKNSVTAIEEYLQALDEDDYAPALFALVHSFKVIIDCSQKENARLRDLMELLAENKAND